MSALSKVFPSVSKKDELSYSRLETSLRKTRSHITETEKTETQKPAPQKPGLPGKGSIRK